jgi:hypothetical protein
MSNYENLQGHDPAAEAELAKDVPPEAEPQPEPPPEKAA